jgi:hypothetical protein
VLDQRGRHDHNNPGELAGEGWPHGLLLAGVVTAAGRVPPGDRETGVTHFT